jgi:hypothetical protein
MSIVNSWYIAGPLKACYNLRRSAQLRLVRLKEPAHIRHATLSMTEPSKVCYGFEMAHLRSATTSWAGPPKDDILKKIIKDDDVFI